MSSYIRALWVVAGAGLFLLCWLFVYNSGGGYYRSGYGYDALEYLVIGRSLNDGYPFYAFIPSKSWGLYALIAGYLRIPFAGTHAGLSFLVTALLALVGGVTFRVMLEPFGKRAAVFAAGLVVLAGLFMELNYLEPEGLVVLATLMAFRTLTRNDGSDRSRRWLEAGIWIGIGVAFKSVAALSAIGALVWVWGSRRGLRNASALLAGVGIAVMIPALYFWWTGRLQPHLEWSLVFPLWQYPMNTIWATKLAIKLLWVWAVIISGIVASRASGVRDQLRWSSAAGLLVCMGAMSLVPLLKTQASHYAFPGAALLLCFSAVAIDRWIATRGFAPRLVGVAAVCGLAGVLAAGAIYRPEALARLTTVEAYGDESTLKASIARLVPADKRALFFTRSAALYWVTHRYPPWPVLNTDVQTTYTIERRGSELLKALDDPALALVEFDPRAALVGDDQLTASEQGRRFLTTFECLLIAGFDRRDDLVPPLVLWLPKADRRAPAEPRRIG